MKQQKFIISLLLIFTILSGCKEDFLSIEQDGKYSSGNYYNSQEKAEELITGCYGILTETWPNMYLKHPLVGGDLRSDDALTGGDPDKPPLDRIRMANFDIRGDNPDVIAPWVVYFAGIRRACIAIETISDMSDDLFDTPEVKKRMIAEARFLRAFHYQYLVKFYGKVPIVDHTLAANEKNLTRRELNEVYDFIEEDLNYCIENLNWKADTERGRATKGAAIYLLVSALIHEAKTDASHENWQKAYDLAKPLVFGDNQNEYSLVESYGRIWHQDNQFHDETIFEVLDKGLTNNATSTWYHVFTHPRFVKGPPVNSKGEPVEGDSIRWGTFGWGVGCPTQDLVDAFEAGDPRLHYSVWMEGDTLQIGGVNPGTKKPDGEPRPVWLKDTPTGYYRKKTMLTSMPDQYSADLTVILFRYADLVLFFSEAAYYVGKENEAKQAVNLIRERARDGNNSILPDITSSGDQLLRDIWHERRIELNMEGHRFFDLVRQERAAEVLHAFGQDAFIENKHELYPLPAPEIQIAPELLPNNPGY